MTVKTSARQLSGDTLPFVRHLLFHTASTSLQCGPSLVTLTIDPWNAPTVESDDGSTDTHVRVHLKIYLNCK